MPRGLMHCQVNFTGTVCWLFTSAGPVEVSNKLFERSDGALDLEEDRSWQRHQGRVLGSKFLTGVHGVDDI